MKGDSGRGHAVILRERDRGTTQDNIEGQDLVSNPEAGHLLHWPAWYSTQNRLSIFGSDSTGSRDPEPRGLAILMTLPHPVDLSARPPKHV